MEETRTKVIRIVLGTLIPTVCTIINIPLDVTAGQVIFALIIFYVILYFVIGTMKYYIVSDIKI
tara:strand:+ start:1158 stop:1349 length:192 start_codon:yes stop_codon:yes gene_type:complete